MGAHKLDIEFEDEDDTKAKEDAAKKEAEAQKQADSADELEFDVNDEADDEPVAQTPAPAAAAPAAAPAPAPAQKAAPAQQQQQAQPQVQQVQQQVPAQQVQTGAYMNASPGAANYNLGDELRNVIGGNRILEIELQAKVEIAVTHRLTTIIAENAQDNKVLETKINRILSQVAAKVPALKKELAMIKKHLAEHSTVDKSKLSSEEKPASASAPVAKKRPAPAPGQAPAKKKAA